MELNFVHSIFYFEKKMPPRIMLSVHSQLQGYRP